MPKGTVINKAPVIVHHLNLHGDFLGWEGHPTLISYVFPPWTLRLSHSRVIYCIFPGNKGKYQPRFKESQMLCKHISRTGEFSNKSRDFAFLKQVNLEFKAEAETIRMQL